MKICECEILGCPYCRKSDRYLKEIKTEIPNMHTIHCLACLGIFFIPCED